MSSQCQLDHSSALASTLAKVHAHNSAVVALHGCLAWPAPALLLGKSRSSRSRVLRLLLQDTTHADQRDAEDQAEPQEGHADLNDSAMDVDGHGHDDWHDDEDEELLGMQAEPMQVCLTVGACKACMSSRPRLHAAPRTHLRMPSTHTGPPAGFLHAARQWLLCDSNLDNGPVTSGADLRTVHTATFLTD